MAALIVAGPPDPTTGWTPSNPQTLCFLEVPSGQAFNGEGGVQGDGVTRYLIKMAEAQPVYVKPMLALSLPIKGLRGPSTVEVIAMGDGSTTVYPFGYVSGEVVNG